MNSVLDLRDTADFKKIKIIFGLLDFYKRPEAFFGILTLEMRALFRVGAMTSATALGLRMSSSSSSSATGSAAAKLSLALCQIKVGSDKVANIEHARKTLERACASGAQMLVLPECWNSPYAVASFPVYAERAPEIGDKGTSLESTASPSSVMLCNVAKENKVWLVGGSIPERDSSGKLFNTCLIINPTGQVVGKHRKVHLFDIDVPGKITFKESDSLSAGQTVTVVDTPWGGLGVGICYDIRFPELAIMMRQRGCNLLVYPGAFNMVTGPAHWELLQRARAVDNQLFVATCSPARDATGGGYVAWGHSSVINPWGQVMQSAGPDEAVVMVDIDLAEVQTMRDSIPCWKQKRDDIYELRSKM